MTAGPGSGWEDSPAPSGSGHRSSRLSAAVELATPRGAAIPRGSQGRRRHPEAQDGTARLPPNAEARLCAALGQRQESPALEHHDRSRLDLRGLHLTPHRGRDARLRPCPAGRGCDRWLSASAVTARGAQSPSTSIDARVAPLRGRLSCASFSSVPEGQGCTGPLPPPSGPVTTCRGAWRGGGRGVLVKTCGSVRHRRSGPYRVTKRRQGPVGHCQDVPTFVPYRPSWKGMLAHLRGHSTRQR